ncbi:MAG: hypothetical protein JO303_00595 [Caulobacteraceae bacterium]|nr:hypothetical protein [Caulobacteraceae bacterium]
MINTVTGQTQPDQLGKTLMHEHLAAGFSGWRLDPASKADRREELAICVDQLEALKAAGYTSLLDPCPNDVGRDVDLMGEAAARTGFNIICATGFYNEHLGGNAYWVLKSQYDPDFVDRLADLMIAELTEGVAGTSIKAGVIKLATGLGPMSDYERKVFAAGAKACLATGAPITTHTDAMLGEVQLQLLTSLGVPAHKIIIGHSCGSQDHAYHMGLIDGGAYVGFDRFGIEGICPDDVRVASMMKLLQAGKARQLVVSHDSVWCLRGALFPPAMVEEMKQRHGPLRFETVIRPKLLAAGATDKDIETMMVDNPRRYFAGVPHQHG